MSINLYAHTGKNVADKSDWQTLDDHLTGTAIRSAGGIPPEISGVPQTESESDENYWHRFALLLYMGGLLHDIGKSDDEFQEYLEKSLRAELTGDATQYRCSVNHSEAGAAWAKEQLGFVGMLLAYMIAGHHAGLPDWNTDHHASLQNRLEKGKKNLDRIRDRIGSLIEKIVSLTDDIKNKKLGMPKSFRLEKGNCHLLIRMLFSRLVDADRLDTEAFCDPEQSKTRGRFNSIPELKDRFDRYMKRFDQQGTEPSDSTAQRLLTARNDVLTACRNVGRTASNHLFTLTVPTGGGKTLSSMAFALEYAVSHHYNRIIYVIPYTSIIEQNANVFRKIFGSENIVEHHSNFDMAKIKRNSSSGNGSDNVDDSNDSDQYEQQMNLAAENWDAPIILTTNVQFFESLYAAKPSRCRKIHRIAQSVVILDEAQMITEEFLSPCVDVLNHLTRLFETAIVLCTATQPALTDLDQLHTGAKGLDHTCSIHSDSAALYRDLKRVRFEFDDLNQSRSWEDIADELEQNDEVLCIVNTRKDAYELYNILVERENARRSQAEEFHGEDWSQRFPETIHLSALMCGEHRSLVIDSIRDRLEENRTLSMKKPLRVISTQLVEAGVDIDFPVVFRALAGFDSIAQAAGRCNREGRLGPDGGLVRVFVPPKQAPAGLLRKGADTTKNLMVAGLLDPQSPDSYTKYFELFYAGLNNIDQKDILTRLSQNVNPKIEIPFRTVAEDFHLIDDDYASPVYVQYGEGLQLIERLRMEGVHRELMRKLQRYCVNVPKQNVFNLVNEGKLEEIFPGIIVQTIPMLYNDVFGLDLFNNSHADGFFV